MDQKLGKQQFRAVVEQAYPSYVLKLPQLCFKLCVSQNRPGATFQQAESHNETNSA